MQENGKRDRELVSAVLFQLDATGETVEALFPDASEDYKAEWYRRNPFAFWCHLDNGNRARVLRLARQRMGGQDDGA